MNALLHRLTHRHIYYRSAEVGVVRDCSWRLPWSSRRLLWWPGLDQPEGDPVEIPADRLNAWLDATTQLERLWALS